MSENMGPCEADCPAAILELLSPTDHEYALDWRARCRANLVLRARNISDGDRIRLPEPLTFTDGNVAQGFRSEEHTSELQALMRNSSAVFCLKKKTKSKLITQTIEQQDKS